MYIIKELQHILKQSLEELNIRKNENEIIITKEDDCYKTNIAISIARELHKKPEEVGEILRKSLVSDLIEKVDLIYPGILNIKINKRYLLRGIAKIIEENINYGKSNIGKKRRVSIMLSKIDANQDLSINDLKCITYGDNLARILKYNNYDVTTEIYVKSDKINETNNLLEDIRKSLDNLRINFNNYVMEEDLYNSSKVDNVLDILNRKGYTYFDKESLWLKTTLFNDNIDQRLISNDGTYSDLMPSIAYHIDRLNNGYDGLIDVINKDSYQGLLPSLRLLSQNVANIDIKIANIDNNNCMELINKYNSNQIRFLFADNDLNVIDYNLYFKSINENNDKFSVIEKCNREIYQLFNNYHKKINKVNNFSTIKSDIAYIIMNKLYEFTDIVVESCIKQKTSIITDYTYELVQLFDKFYKEEKIISEDEVYTIEHLNLVLAIKIVLNNSLDLIGIIPRETF